MNDQFSMNLIENLNLPLGINIQWLLVIALLEI